VIATSYGARVAQKLLERDEKGIDRLVFNSPHFLHSLLMDWKPFPLVERVMEKCNEDDVCRASYPSLYWDFQGLRFDIGKVKLSDKALDLIKDSTDPAKMLDADEKQEQLKSLVYHLYRQRLQSLLARHRASEVPRDIWKTTTSMQKALQEETPWSPPEPLSTNMKKISQLVHFTIFCQEDGARMKAKGWDTIAQPLYANFYRNICEKLDGPKLKKGWDKVKKSKKPILILTGELDTVVEPDSAQKALSLYPNAIWLRFPTAGHDVPAHNSCARAAQMDFLNGKKPNANCQAEEPLLFMQRDQQIRTTG
jgi:pimeloyl-ACP methyl ester carboxylesterase